MRTVGSACWAMSSPCRVMRARRWLAATPASARASSAAIGPEPRTSMSIPASVAVAWMSSGFKVGRSVVAMAAAASMAPARPGARTGHRSIGTIRWAWAAANPTSRISWPPASRMQDGAPPALAMRIDEVGDRRRDTGVVKLVDHERALPRAVTRRRPMLNGTAAAGAEMPTDRLDALRTRGRHAHEVAAVGMAGRGIDLDDLAGQRIGNIDGPRGTAPDPVAAMAHVVDGERFNQARPRERIRGCRRRRRWARGLSQRRCIRARPRSRRGARRPPGGRPDRARCPS